MTKSFSTFILILLLAVISCAAEPQYMTIGKLIVGGAEVNPRLENGDPIPDSFYGTSIELLQSGEVLKRAHARVHALLPDLQPQDCKVEAGRLPGTRIIVLRASAAAPAYVRAYLDAVMDEFLAKRKEMRADGGQGARLVLMDELVRLEKEIPLAEQRIKASEQNKTSPDQLVEPRAKLQQMKMAYDRHLGTLRKLQEQQHGSGEVFSILERASAPLAVKAAFSLLDLFK